MELAEKLKMALDEARLLILGAQVVFGCQFQMVFQERFQDAPRDSQAVQGIGLLALMRWPRRIWTAKTSSCLSARVFGRFSPRSATKSNGFSATKSYSGF